MAKSKGLEKGKGTGGKRGRVKDGIMGKGRGWLKEGRVNDEKKGRRVKGGKMEEVQGWEKGENQGWEEGGKVSVEKGGQELVKGVV